MRRLWLPGGIVALIVLTAIAAPLLPLPDPVRQDIANRLAGSMSGSWLGRDEFGRDAGDRADAALRCACRGRAAGGGGGHRLAQE